VLWRRSPGDTAVERFEGNDPGRKPEEVSYVQRARALLAQAREDATRALNNAECARATPPSASPPLRVISTRLSVAAVRARRPSEQDARRPI
jgi:hypothetical protein